MSRKLRFERRFDIATMGAYNFNFSSVAVMDRGVGLCQSLGGVSRVNIVTGDAVGHEGRADVRLRAHTLLCLQGFRGEGYSPSFIDNLARVHCDLAEHPEQWVEVVDAPDTVCGACPHLASAGCSLGGDGFEESMKAQDRQVLRLLGLQAGIRVRWSEILERIRTAITGDSLPSICGQCRWLPLGYCRDGIERLRGAGHARSAGLIPAKELRRDKGESS